MTVEPYSTVTIDGQEFWRVYTLVPKENDPDRGSFIFFAKPLDGVSGIAGLVKGDPGKHTEFDTAVDFTVLEPNDPTPDSVQVVELVPGSDTVSQKVQLEVKLHKGEKGDDGVSVLDLESVEGTAAAGAIPVVNNAVDAFTYATQRVGDRYIPASINSVASGNANFTLCAVTIPSQPWDWRPSVTGQCTVVGTGTNVAVDLVARLNTETTGNIVGRCFGEAGQNPAPMALVSGPPAGSASGYDKVSAGDIAVIYFRTERRTGSDTYTASSTTMSFCVRVEPVLTDGS